MPDPAVESELLGKPVDSAAVRTKLIENGINPTESGLEFYSNTIKGALEYFTDKQTNEGRQGKPLFAIPADERVRGKKNVVFSIGRGDSEPAKTNIGIFKAIGLDDVNGISGIHAVLIVDFDKNGRPKNIRIVDLSRNGTFVKHENSPDFDKMINGRVTTVSVVSPNPNGNLRYYSGDQFNFSQKNTKWTFVDTNLKKMEVAGQEVPISFGLYALPKTERLPI
jgi:hypothetical protein